MLIDSDCHLYMPDFDADGPAALARARSAGLALADVAACNACRAFGVRLGEARG